jgi:hypothetical protein
MMTCREVTRLVASEELAEVSWTRRLTARMHFLFCRHCREYSGQISSMGRMAREGWEPSEDRVDEQRIEADILSRIPGEESPPTDG